MAAGVVSGTAALVLEANRAAFPSTAGLTPNAVKAILQFSAVRLRGEDGVLYNELTQGAGGVNRPELSIGCAHRSLTTRLCMVAHDWRSDRNGRRR